jgi:hypothetical protein
METAYSEAAARKVPQICLKFWDGNTNVKYVLFRDKTVSNRMTSMFDPFFLFNICG